MYKFLRALTVSRSGALTVGFLLLSPLSAHPQSSHDASSRAFSLPDAPSPQAAASQSADTSGSAILSGTIVDTNGDVLQGARVELLSISGVNVQAIQSGADGQFTFSGVAPGAYKLTIAAGGMSTYSSSEIALNAGEVRIVPEIVLAVTGGETTVTVTADKEQLAEEQVQIAVQQRVFRVLPNFYSAYDWNAPPMQAKQKFKLSVRSTFDPTTFLVIAGVAGAEQYKNVFPGYGGGIEGYGKRYGAAFANHVTAQLFSRAIYPSVFRQDPRYFYKGSGSATSRAFYAVSAAVVSRNDNGHWGPNYSNVLGNVTSAAISNFYYPESDRGVSLVLFNGLASTGADAVENLIKEFILKGITSHVPKDENGQP